MRRKNGNEILVKNPAKGLQTFLPSDLPSEKMGQYITVAQNVRAERGTLSNAPGYERIVTTPGNLDSPANLIHQANLSGRKDDARTAPIVGTEKSLYVLGRRARQKPVCLRGGGPVDSRCSDPAFALEHPEICNVGGSHCITNFALVGDSGRVSDDAANVATLIRNSNPDFVVHLGDQVYGTSDYDVSHDIFEELYARYYWWGMGGYKGVWGEGPERNIIFSTMNNHEYEDVIGGPEERYTEINRFPGDGINYTFKRGCVQVWVLSSYGPQTRVGATSGETDLSSTGPLATWVKETSAVSDAVWKIVCIGYPPWNSQKPDRYHILRWPFGEWGVQAVISGDAHCYERLNAGDGVLYLISGLGGKSKEVAGSLIPQSQYFYNTDYGALFATADYSTLFFQFKDQTGTVIDTATLTNTGAGSVCYVSDLASQPDTLTVVPVSSTFEVGQYWQFRAYLYRADGSSSDVTSLATWTSEDTGKAAVVGGKVTGVSVAEGVEITAAYSGLTATAEVDVVAACVDRPTELVLVLETSESMNSASGFGKNRLDRLKEASLSLLDSLDPDIDKIAVITFSGNVDTQTENAAVLSPLTDDFASVRLAISGIVASGDSGTAAGLALALSEVDVTETEPKHKLVVLFADNPADVSTGGRTDTLAHSRADAMSAAETQVNLIKAVPNCCLSVVTLDVDSTYLVTFQTWATLSLFFPINTAESLPTVLGNLNNLFCMHGCDGYYVTNPACETGDPRLNYDEFINFEVISGLVDLCGVGNTGIPLYDIWPGHGLYVDLRGSSGLGIMQTRTAYSVTAGQTIRLTFKLAGNGRQEGVESITRVRIEPQDSGADLLDELITVPVYENFTLHSYELIVPNTGSIKIVFEAYDGPAEQWADTGNFLDDVLLENVSTGITLLDDNFDEETC